MADPLRKYKQRKGSGHMDKVPDLIAATLNMDLEKINEIYLAFPEAIEQVDSYGNNVMHICVAGGGFRVQQIIEYYINDTSVDLLHRNNDGYCPYELAIALNDDLAMSLLEVPTHNQLSEENKEDGPDIRPI